MDGGFQDPAHGPEPRDYLQFVLGAVRRRPVLTISVFLVCAAVLVLYYASRTPLYRVEARILAQRQQALPSITRSSIAEDQPTRGAQEIVHRRENIEDLIRQAGLVDAPPKLDAIDRLRNASSRLADSRSATSDPLEDLVLLVDRRLKVEVGEVTIAIWIDWADPKQAYRIVDGALQDFLETRHVQDVTAMDETIAILQGRASALRDELSKAIDEARRSGDGGRVARAPLPSTAGATQTRQGSEDLARLRSMLDAKERAINDVEGFRRRRLSELQAQYDARKAVYAEGHPDMINLRQDIAALAKDSPQITALREEERALREEYQARLSRERPGVAAAHLAPVSDARPLPDSSGSPVEQNERVRDSRFRYQQAQESINRAQVELDTARAAFNHRYKVIWPPRVPTTPIGPNPLKIFGMGGLAAVLLALFSAAAADWRSGRLQERWQIERGLGLPVIADLGRK